MRPLFGILSSAGFYPSSLFSGGVQGVWYDPSDITTLFQDSAGTTPVTAVEQPVGKMLDKSGNANHMVQATAASRPTYRARYNLLTYSNQADNAAWTKSNSFVQTNLLTYSQDITNAAWLMLGTAGGSRGADETTAPDGTFTADRYSVGTGSGAWYIANYANPSIISGQTYTFSAYVKANGTGFVFVRPHNNSANFAASGFIVSLSDGSITYPSAALAPASTGTVTNAGNGWWRISATSTANLTTATTGGPGLWPCTSTSFSSTNGVAPANFTGDGVSGIYIWGAQLVQGSVPGDYRATTSAALPVLYADYNGALRARKLCEDATATVIHRCTETTTMLSGPCTASVYAKAGERTKLTIDLSDNSTGDVIYNFDLSAGTASSGGSAGSWTGLTGNILSLGNGWYRCLITGVRGAGAQTVMSIITANAAGSTTYTGDGSSGIYIADAQLVTGSVPGNYQNINAATDYDTVGFLPYLALDGVDDSMGTAATVNLSATNKAFVVAGINKQSDAAQAVVAELTASVALNNGSFALTAPNSAAANFNFSSKGTSQVDNTVVTYAAPYTAVLTVTADIGAPSNAIRVNGGAATTVATSQGTGNYSNATLFLGRRNNATLPFTGSFYGLIVAGKAPSTNELNSTTSFMNGKTGAY